MQPEDVSDAMRIGLSGMELDDEISFRPVRVALERQAALAATRRPDESALASMHAALQAIRVAESPDEKTRADVDFHAALFEASGEPSLRFMYGAVRGLMDDSVARRRAQLAKNPAGLEESFRLHAEILAAVQSGDGRRSMDAVDALIAQDVESH
ncbi:FadR/GntR family transcriptional regulator [Citricoccus sp. GCM10030269]|uniref:FadR/GntR family transcriptional regulator n=1 Tax=Citricoccus sp. GCM10030269 TaxID=3273388 RepID=UPI00361878C3